MPWKVALGTVRFVVLVPELLVITTRYPNELKFGTMLTPGKPYGASDVSARLKPSSRVHRAFCLALLSDNVFGAATARVPVADITGAPKLPHADLPRSHQPSRRTMKPIESEAVQPISQFTPGAKAPR